MAIAFDNATDGGLVNPGMSLTYSHTTSGTNRILFVSAFGDVDNDFIFSITYNGVAMTLIGKNHPTGDRVVYLYMLVNPALGANDVVVSAASSIAIASHAESYTGAAQSSQPNDSIDGFTNPANPTFVLTVTTTVDNCWVAGAFRTDSTGGTFGTGITQRENSFGLYTGDSNGVVHPAGSYSMEMDNGGSAGWAGVIAAFAPFTGGTVTPSKLSSLGVG